jgi:hypothetical protein
MKIQALLEVLDCSSSGNEIVDRILYGCAEEVRKCLTKILASCKDSHLSDNILSIYNSMPQSFRSRVLASAELGEWLSGHDRAGNRLNADAASAFTALLDILRREELIYALLTGESPGKVKFEDLGEESIWSPLGDWMAYKSDGEWKAKQLPTIGNAIAVDSDSPLALRDEPRSGVLSRRRLPLTESEHSTILAKLNTALSNIDQVIPEYGILIRSFTRRIIVRKSVEESLSSEHVPMQPGAIRILNPHLDDYTVTACMETLMHESTHNFLAAWETMNGSFVSSGNDYRPISPWSGNPIPNASFVHATFIYYACHKLFSTLLTKADKCEEIDLDTATLRLSTFATGFLIKRKISDMLVLKDQLDSSLVETIDLMEAKMQDVYKTYSKQQSDFAGTSEGAITI